MSLARGDRLGPYELLSPIGEGGMGEVWKARDTRLDRTVAIKISKQQFTERFEREARANAALNHSNICQLYDVGPNYLVMEFIEGVQLKGPLPVEKAVEYAVQILDALDAAHRKGITHRDLKPANILITKQGIKLLDFGLAKQAASIQQIDATLTKAITAEGQIAGTLQYMAPEQLQAKEVDSRSDIFAFGCVLYEMISGKKAFDGTSAASVIAAILEREPETLSVTPPLARVIWKCLAKEPDDRFQTARDLKTALLWVGEPTPPVSAGERKRPRAVWLAVVVFLVLAVITVDRALVAVPPIDLSKVRLTPVASEQSEHVAAGWAPDGERFAYTVQSLTVGPDSPTQVRVQALGGTATDILTHGVEIPGNAPFGSPMFSPDGNRLFVQFSPSTVGTRASVYSVASSGGVPEPVVETSAQARIAASDLSPDGKSMALVVTDPKERSSVALYSPANKSWHALPNSPVMDDSLRVAQLKFSPDGKRLLVMFVAQATTTPTQFWLCTLAGGEKPVRLFSQLPPLGNEAGFDWMPDGRYIGMTPGRTIGAPLLLGDTQTGKLLPVTANNSHFAFPAVSRQGRILLTEMQRNHDIVEIPLDGSTIQELQATARNEHFAVWSPVRDEYFYATDRRGIAEIWLGIPGRGAHRPIAGPEQLGAAEGASLSYLSVSPDGERLGVALGGRMWIVPVSGGVPTAVTPIGVSGTRLEWSPDGQWIVYGVATTARMGAIRVARMGSQETPKDLMEVSQGQLSLWSPDGKWITFENKDGLGILSPDGATKRVLLPAALEPGSGLCWAPDSQSLYLLRRIAGENVLSSLDIRTGRVTILRKMDGSHVYGQIYSTRNAMRLSRDGKRLTVTRRATTTNLWLLEGLEVPKPWWNRLW